MPGLCSKSQSPENGSRHCKPAGVRGGQPRKTQPRRNPLKTGLGTARVLPLWYYAREETSQSPENGSRHCKPRPLTDEEMKTVIVSQSPENGSRHCKAEQGPHLGPLRLASQSPENGSRHCKGPRRRGRGRGGFASSQSPENGSRHCKPAAGGHRDHSERPGLSQSPENGSRHCKVIPGRAASFKLPCRNPLKTGLGTASRITLPPATCPWLRNVAIP